MNIHWEMEGDVKKGEKSEKEK